MMITMVSPHREQCGVADYSKLLLAELRRRVDVRFETDAARFEPGMNAVDVVHVQHQYFLFGGVAPWKNHFGTFADRLRARTVMTVHEIVPPHGSAVQRAAIRVTNRRQFQHPRVSRLLVHTTADREMLLRQGVQGGRVHVVRHGVPPAPCLPDRSEARAALGLDGRFVVTLFGFLSSRKGHRLAVDAMPLLPADTVLLLAGGRHPDDGTPYAVDLERHIQARGIVDRVRVTGYLGSSDLNRVMSATDVVIAPYAGSSGSGSLAFAFACGKPIVASDIPAHREMLSDTPTGLCLTEAGGAAALATALSELKEHPDKLQVLAAGARRYAECHTYGRMADETVSIYSSVIAEEAP